MTTNALYRYACECGSSYCGEVMALPRVEWERLARRGAVVHKECAIGRKVRAAYGEARAVRTTAIRAMH